MVFFNSKKKKNIEQKDVTSQNPEVLPDHGHQAVRPLRPEQLERLAPQYSGPLAPRRTAAYELAREQKIRENEAMLKQLGLFEDAANMRAALM